MFYELKPDNYVSLITKREDQDLQMYDVGMVNDEITICHNLKEERVVAISKSIANLQESMDVLNEIYEQIEREIIGEEKRLQEIEMNYFCCEPM